jgi:hypothetical protein
MLCVACTGDRIARRAVATTRTSGTAGTTSTTPHRPARAAVGSDTTSPQESLVKRIDRRGLEERALLAAARAGDAHAFRCLLDRHRFGLELYCYLMVGGDVAFARRVLADAVLTAWRERGFVGPETDARVWLYKLASRVCIEAAGDHLPDRGPTSGSCR